MRICRIIKWLSPVLLTTLAAAQADGRVCCRLKANRKFAWENRLTVPSPKSDGSCKWQPEFLGEITFVGPDRIAVSVHSDCYGWDETKNHPKLERTTDSLFLVDSRTGNILNHRSWQDLGTQALEPTLFSIGSSRILLFRGGRTLRLYSADLEELRARTLPLTPSVQRWEIYLSPNRKIGVLTPSTTQENVREEHWFSTERLEDTRVELAPKYSSHIAVSNDADVYYSPSGDTRGLIYVRKGEERGYSLCDSCTGLATQVMPNGVLLMTNGPPRAAFSLVDRSGKTLFDGAYGERRVELGEVVFASKNDRFAFSHGGGNAFWGLGRYWAIVFDMVSMKEVFRIKIDMPLQPMEGGEYWPTARIALSPEGDRLAVLYGARPNDARLQLFAIDNVKKK